MNTRTILRGSVENLDIEVQSDLPLVAQTVEFSFDKTNWLAAGWIGASGPTRTARLLMNADNLPAAGRYTIYVRVTDTPEIPVVEAGFLHVK